MKSLILYATRSRLSEDDVDGVKYTTLWIKTENPQYVIYPVHIRSQVFEGSVDQALENANPIGDEIVLNTIPLDH